MSEREKAIRSACRKAGLDLAEVEVEGDVLQLVPASLEKATTLDAEDFQRLALELKATWGFRYVTLVIDEGKDEH